MNLFGRSNVISSLRFLFLNQPSSLISSLKHQAVSTCAVCIHKQVIQPSCAAVQKRYQHTPSYTGLQDMTTWQKMKWKMGFYGKLQVPTSKLQQAGYNLYTCCTDFINFSEFVKVLNLPDTFNSWFLLLQLHLWMVNVKLSQMGKEGAILKHCIYRSMWHNVEERLHKFKDLSAKERVDALRNYQTEMILSIMYYDEGLLGCDKTLAGSLWVQLFSLDSNIEADKLELMVKYVRKQVHHHDYLDPHLIMSHGYISFLPLLEDQLDQQKVYSDFRHLTDDQGQ